MVLDPREPVGVLCGKCQVGGACGPRPCVTAGSRPASRCRAPQSFLLAVSRTPKSLTSLQSTPPASLPPSTFTRRLARLSSSLASLVSLVQSQHPLAYMAPCELEKVTPLGKMG